MLLKSIFLLFTVATAGAFSEVEKAESPLDQALIAAVDDPTNQEAVLEFLFLQRQAIDQATRFAEQWAAVLAKETEESPDAGESVMDSPCHRDSKGDLG